MFSIIKHIYWLITRSLYLDIRLISCSEISFDDKWSLLFNKYIELFKTHIIKSNNRVVKIIGHKYYYFDEFAHSMLISLSLDNLFLRKLINPGSIVVDVGANIGQYYFFAKHLLHAKIVFSFEPVPYIYQILKKNNPNSINLAIGTKTKGMITIPDGELFASLCLETKSNSIPVQIAQLDSIKEIKRLKLIDLLKIDVEGSELDVIRSASKTIRKTRYVLVEISIDRPAQGDMSETIALLKKIEPYLKVIHVGEVLIRLGKNECVDVLFKNLKYE